MSLSIILAEDEPDIRLVASLALKRAGFRVRVATNGNEVLAAAGAEKPDAILLDWMMPDMDGPQTFRHLKDNPATADIPIIFLTARSQESEVQRGLAMGAAGYITKPFDALRLGQSVRDLLLARG